MSNSSNTFLINVKKCMEKHDLNISDMAKKLDMHQPAVSRLLSGNNEPTLETVEKVAELFGLSVDQMLKEGGDKKSIKPKEVGYEEALNIVFETLYGIKTAYSQIDDLEHRISKLEKRVLGE